MTQIGHEEWLAELERLQGREQNDEGHTTRELAELWGCNHRTAVARLEEIHRAGRLIVGRKTVMAIDGRRARVPTYRLKP